MKKIIAFMLAAVLIIGLAACGDKQEETQPKQEVMEQANVPEETETPVEEDKESWGAVTIDQYVTTEDGTNFFLINFPEGTPSASGAANISINSGGTITMVGGEDDNYFPDITSVEELLPAFSEQIMVDLGDFLGSRYENMDLLEEDKELVEINGYTCCKYTGTHAFSYMTEPESWQYVLYAIELNNSDAYAYVLVLDISEEQSNKEVIDELAYNMVSTIQEI